MSSVKIDFPRRALVALMFLLLLVPAAFGAEAKGRGTEVVVITLEQAKRLYDLGAVFIDVRSDREWQLGHITNARHLDFRRNFARLKDMKGINKETALVFYCSMRECKAGPYASAVTMEWGYENVFYFQDGYFAWMLEDYPINMDVENRYSTVTSGTIQIRKAPGYRE